MLSFFFQAPSIMYGPLPTGAESNAFGSSIAAFGSGRNAVTPPVSESGNWLSGARSLTVNVVSSTTFRPDSVLAFGLPLAGLRSA